MSEENKAVVRRYMQELITGGNLDVADEIFHPNFINSRGSSMWSNVPDSVKQALAKYHISFPDLRREIIDMVAEGDKVTLYSVVTGTHEAVGASPFVGTGEHVTMSGVSTYLLQDGRIIDEPWANWNFGDINYPLAKAVMRRWVEEGWNQRKAFDLIGDTFSPDVVIKSDDREYKGHESIRQFITAVLTGFPDFHNELVDLVAEGDKLVSHHILSGTHEGEFMGLAPTGKKFKATAVGIFRFADGKIVEGTQLLNTLGLMQQLGATIA